MVMKNPLLFYKTRRVNTRMSARIVNIYTFARRINIQKLSPSHDQWQSWSKIRSYVSSMLSALHDIFSTSLQHTYT